MALHVWPRDLEGLGRSHQLILSFDCAHKSLGVTLLAVDHCWFALSSTLSSTLSPPPQPPPPKQLPSQLPPGFILLEVKVVDLLPGLKLGQVSALDRARALKQALGRYSSLPPSTIVLVEEQPPKNNKSTTVQDQLLLFFCDWLVKLVQPMQKNKVHFGLPLDLVKLSHGSNYSANKAHSRANFEPFARANSLDISHIPTANLDDAADSFMQAVAWLHPQGDWFAAPQPKQE